jgi:hypothetical protein
MDMLTVRHEMPPGGTMDSAQSAVAKVIAAKRRKTSNFLRRPSAMSRSSAGLGSREPLTPRSTGQHTHRSPVDPAFGNILEAPKAGAPSVGPCPLLKHERKGQRARPCCGWYSSARRWVSLGPTTAPSLCTPTLLSSTNSSERNSTSPLRTIRCHGHK